VRNTPISKLLYIYVSKLRPRGMKRCVQVTQMQRRKRGHMTPRLAVLHCSKLDHGLCVGGAWGKEWEVGVMAWP
jgi:hypothetical protein